MEEAKRNRILIPDDRIIRFNHLVYPKFEYEFRVLDFLHYTTTTYNNKSGYIFWKGISLKDIRHLGIERLEKCEIHFAEEAFWSEYSKFGKKILKQTKGNIKDVYIKFSRTNRSGFHIVDVQVFEVK